MRSGCPGGAILAFIPRHIPNGAVLFLYDLLRRRGRKTAFPAVSGASARAMEGARPAGDALRGDVRALPYIEDQRRRGGERFGRSTVARAGCEVIALYNMLLFLYGRETVSFPALVAAFARRGAALGGFWGTSPKALRRFLETWDDGALSVGATADGAAFEAIARTYPCVIASFYNDAGDIRRGVHTVCLTREADGFVAHNLTEDGRSRGPFLSVAAALGSAGDVRGLYLIGAKKRLNN